MTDHYPLTQEKDSKYQTYRPLKYQELITQKNKFDNRLYFSLRYKTFNYVEKVTDELFKVNHNRGTLKWLLMYQENKYWKRRYDILFEYSYFGTNKYGMKKLYKIERFLEHQRNISTVIFLFVGLNIAYLSTALYYTKLRHDLWMHSYGDYFPTYVKLGNFWIRTHIRKLTYYLLSWKLISFYNFSKYDVQTVQLTTGYAYVMTTQWYVRKEEYERKRDSTFDFMQIGESDFEYYTDDYI